MKNLKKYALGTFILCILVVINLKVALDFQQSYDSTMSSIQTLTASNEEKGYEFYDHACSYSTNIDANGYITIGTKKFKVGSISGEYSKSWEKAARDCMYGGNYVSCKTVTCTDFYAGLTQDLI